MQSNEGDVVEESNGHGTIHRDTGLIDKEKLQSNLLEELVIQQVKHWMEEETKERKEEKEKGRIQRKGIFTFLRTNCAMNLQRTLESLQDCISKDKFEVMIERLSNVEKELESVRDELQKTTRLFELREMVEENERLKYELETSKVKTEEFKAQILTLQQNNASLEKALNINQVKLEEEEKQLADESKISHLGESK